MECFRGGVGMKACRLMYVVRHGQHSLRDLLICACSRRARHEYQYFETLFAELLAQNLQHSLPVVSRFLMVFFFFFAPSCKETQTSCLSRSKTRTKEITLFLGDCQNKIEGLLRAPACTFRTYFIVCKVREQIIAHDTLRKNFSW